MTSNHLWILLMSVIVTLKSWTGEPIDEKGFFRDSEGRLRVSTGVHYMWLRKKYRKASHDLLNRLTDGQLHLLAGDAPYIFQLAVIELECLICRDWQPEQVTACDAKGCQKFKFRPFQPPRKRAQRAKGAAMPKTYTEDSVGPSPVRPT